jgi:hypothetical protein
VSVLRKTLFMEFYFFFWRIFAKDGFESRVPTRSVDKMRQADAICTVPKRDVI